MKTLSFGLTALLVAILIGATVVEKCYGTDFVTHHVYSSPLFVVLWGIAALCSLCYLLRRGVQRQAVTFALHLSFGVILLGGLTTYCTGQHGSIHLRQGEEAVSTFTDGDGATHALPFGLTLKAFHLDYYPGTQAPMDFLSELIISDGGERHEERVAMNHICSYRHYRFYQSSYDSDGRGTTLSVAHDPYGIFLSYTGYALLLLSMLAFFFQRGSQFRQLLRHPLLRKGSLATLLLLLTTSLATATTRHAVEMRRHAVAISVPSLTSESMENLTEATGGLLAYMGTSGNETKEGADGYPIEDGIKVGKTSHPKTLPKETATEWGRLYVYYNERVCPLQTLAQDFAMKLCGKRSYRGLTAEQVLSGWVFYYDQWKEEPIIRIKNKRVRTLLGLQGSYASLRDFVDLNGYKLEQALRTTDNPKDKRALEEANEKFNLVSMVCTGSLLKLFPGPADSAQALRWYSTADQLPVTMEAEKALFIHKSMSYLGEQIAMDNTDRTLEVIRKLRKFQQTEGGNQLPSESHIQAELLYNRLNQNLPIAIVCLLLGIVSFVYYLRRMIAGSKDRGGKSTSTSIRSDEKGDNLQGTIISLTLQFLGGIICAFLLLLLCLRGYVSHHLPMSDGYETMQCMAVCALLLSYVLYRRFRTAMAFGFLLCGLALMVARFGEANPPITQLMPVLSSPLLSFHVMVIMVAYALLAFMMFNGVTALVLYGSKGAHREEIERLQVLSRILLYPAVFCLATGIFIGAVWANVSWGRYWGWDPKEVWALITLLIYASALHTASLSLFRRPLFFHLFTVIAFLSVLVTYFGVNFLLGGMHSYA